MYALWQLRWCFDFRFLVAGEVSLLAWFSVQILLGIEEGNKRVNERCGEGIEYFLVILSL